MPEMVCIGPFEKLNLSNDLGTYPNTFLHFLSGQSLSPSRFPSFRQVYEGTLWCDQRTQLFQKFVEEERSCQKAKAVWRFVATRNASLLVIKSSNRCSEPIRVNRLVSMSLAPLDGPTEETIFAVRTTEWLQENQRQWVVFYKSSAFRSASSFAVTIWTVMRHKFRCSISAPSVRYKKYANNPKTRVGSITAIMVTTAAIAFPQGRAGGRDQLHLNETAGRVYTAFTWVRLITGLI